jgi:hypothetical protein
MAFSFFTAEVRTFCEGCWRTPGDGGNFEFHERACSAYWNYAKKGLGRRDRFVDGAERVGD